MTATASSVQDTTPAFYLTDEHEHAEGGSTMLGFWIYLMSDCLIFAILFATYGVLGGNYAAGPAPKDLFDLPLVALNTSMLLLSSITYGFAMLSMDRSKVGATQAWLAATGLFPPMALSFLRTGEETAQLGLMLAYMATRVLGQYDLLINDESPEDQDLVSYVGPNIVAVETQSRLLAVEPR